MKGAIVIFLLCAVYTASVASEYLRFIMNHEPYPRFIQFSDGEGEARDVDLEAPPDEAVLINATQTSNDNLYLLYTRRNPTTPQTLVINDLASIQSSNFNPRLPIAVIVHGWRNNQNHSINPTIRDAFLGKSDVNIIVLDWGKIACSDYVTAVLGVPDVGRGLGQFLAFLHKETGAPHETMYLIGFSLGAHVVGNAGRELGGRAARVTGLDPAGPLWVFNAKRLNATDGVHVEAIHTDGGNIMGGFGIGKAVAKADFFPNGGKNQPGCGRNNIGICNHNRAWKLFACSVEHNGLAAKKCLNAVEVSKDKCSGDQLSLGNDDLNKTGFGLYRVNTDREYPFSVVDPVLI